MTCNDSGKHAHGTENGADGNHNDAGRPWNSRPLYVAMEGIDGSGKTTLIGNIMPRFKDAGLSIDTMKYPRHRSSESVEAVNDRGTVVGQRELNIDMARERADDAPAVLQMDCDIVIFDRYVGSGLAYGMANGFEEKWLKSLDAYSIVPDMTILLDDPATRHRSRSEYLGRVAATYMRLAKKRKWSIVPAKTEGIDDRVIGLILSKFIRHVTGDPADDNSGKPAPALPGSILSKADADKHIAHIHKMITHMINALIEIRGDVDSLTDDGKLTHAEDAAK